MVERRRRSDVSDNVSWWCPHCKGRKSIRDGSFFAKSRLTLQKWLVLMYFWAREYPVGDAAEEAQVQEKVYQWLCEVCSTRLITSRPVVLGGPGAVVQIDESLFRHKPKVAHNNNTIYIQVEITNFIVFRIIEEELQPGKFGFLGWWTQLNPLL